jgi:hypothetical protein
VPASMRIHPCDRSLVVSDPVTIDRSRTREACTASRRRRRREEASSDPSSISLPVFFAIPSTPDDWPPPGTMVRYSCTRQNTAVVKHLDTNTAICLECLVSSLLCISVSALSDHAPLLISTGASFLHRQHVNTRHLPTRTSSTLVSRTAVGHSSLHVGRLGTCTVHVCSLGARLITSISTISLFPTHITVISPQHRR